MSADLPTIPLIDVRDGGPPALARAAEAQMRNLFRSARRTYTPPILAIMDQASRRWLERNGNPYRGEIDAIAALLGKAGAYALNTSYEWTCTSGVGVDPQAGKVRLLRVLDWRQSGLGRNLVVALQHGPVGDFVNITWPGYVGVITAIAPGRFAAAINQPPMPSWGATWPLDWAISRSRVWRSRALPPSHLLRQVFERCATYHDAKRLLQETPLCLPAFFALAGVQPGEGCVIERTPNTAAIREMPAAVANHWVVLRQRGRPRGYHSRERQAAMEAAMSGGSAAWCVPPVANRHTRLVAELNPGAFRLMVQGWEDNRPATDPLALDLPP